MSILRRITLLLAIALVVSWVHAQNSSGNGSGSGGNGSNSSSTSGSNAQVNVEMPTSPPPHQLIQAAPGPIPGMFPGNALGPGACFLYHPKLKNLKYLSSSSIESMAKGDKLPHGVKPTLIDPDPAKAESYNGPIGVMEYDPLGDAINEDDLVLAGIKMPGKPFEVDEKLLGVTIKALKNVAPAMQRVAVAVCYTFAEVTNTNSKGIGFTSSGTNGSGQIGNSFSAGWFKGMSSSEQDKHAVTTVYAMNGPYNLLTSPKPKKDDGAPAQPAAPIPPAVTLPPPAPKEVPVPQAPAPPPPPPVAAAPPFDDCLQDPLPKLNVPFTFASSEITPEGLSVILRLENWLEQHQHPTCRVVMKGGACMHASKEYNLNLGYDRANAVYDVLWKNEKIRSQIIKPESHGKQQATLTGSKADMAADRVVYFAIEGSDSH